MFYFGRLCIVELGNKVTSNQRWNNTSPHTPPMDFSKDNFSDSEIVYFSNTILKQYMYNKVSSVFTNF